MLSNLNIYGDVVTKNGSLIDQEGTAYFDSTSVATNLVAKGGIAEFKSVNILSLTITTCHKYEYRNSKIKRYYWKNLRFN